MVKYTFLLEKSQKNRFFQKWTKSHRDGIHIKKHAKLNIFSSSKKERRVYMEPHNRSNEGDDYIPPFKP